ncbi:MAG: hypothetical protein MJZ65_03095 [Paludibacteraceae bacterium]|nr:hypothetical protein [Paludibacteraceae bacterium]
MAVTKKTAAKKTAKPAAKKAAPAKKATTKKATAKTSPAKKKTTVKKATTAKKIAPTKTTITEISVTGNKKIGTLMKDFNKKFPYLRLKVCYSYAREAVAKGESIHGIDIEKTLASERRADSGGDISISGNKKVKSLEKEFDTTFGLYVQVCYTAKDGHRYYTSGNSDEMTLSAFNAKCEADGCQKGIWK